jgi:hypothetical protein
VDVEERARHTPGSARAARRGDTARAERLRERRAHVDQRFEPAYALQGAGQYLAIAEDRFGSEELAVVSYHMGIGNLEDVLAAYGEDDPTWAQVYFGATPRDHPHTYRLLSGFGDDSATYLWRVYAAREIMRLWREDLDELRELIRLNTAKATAEEVFHPESETEVFEGPEDVEDALIAGRLVPIPTGEELGFRVARGLGELAPELDADPEIYRSLRPEALAALIYMAAQVREISGRPEQRLIVTSATRDRGYQRALVGINPEATDAYSLHTTGFSFDILRRYGSDAQAGAFQFVLDRMKALGVIDYAVEPAAIHITVSELAEELLD